MSKKLSDKSGPISEEARVRWSIGSCSAGSQMIPLVRSARAQKRACAGLPFDQARGRDPLLGPLPDNGGPTDTFALLLGSPATDAKGMGPNGCGELGQTDQRGVSRPQGSGRDIGAFEPAPKVRGRKP